MQVLATDPVEFIPKEPDTSVTDKIIRMESSYHLVLDTDVSQKNHFWNNIRSQLVSYGSEIESHYFYGVSKRTLPVLVPEVISSAFVFYDLLIDTVNNYCVNPHYIDSENICQFVKPTESYRAPFLACEVSDETLADEFFLSLFSVDSQEKMVNLLKNPGVEPVFSLDLKSPYLLKVKCGL